MHIQYLYDNHSIAVVNSTYGEVAGLHAAVQVHSLEWKELYRAETMLYSAPDSAQQVFTLPDALLSGTERIFFLRSGHVQHLRIAVRHIHSGAAGRMGGPLLFLIVNSSLLLANMGSGMASQLGAARLLYAMGQDGAWPRRFFASVTSKSRIPRNNVILVGAVCLVGALAFSYQLGTELLNYGALLAFMGVNISSLLRAWREGRFALWFPMLLSLAGFVTCLLLWINLHRPALIAGSAWAAAGVLLWLLRRRFTVLPADPLPSDV